MELSQQVVNQELSKRMKELGFKQESLFAYADISSEPSPEMEQTQLVYKANKNYLYYYSAYTVAELGEMLEKVRITREKFIEVYCEVMDLAEIMVEEIGYITMANVLMTQPDVSAQMLCYLKENNLL